MAGSRAAVARAAPVGAVRQLVTDYLTLTKPRVQTLLLFTTVTTMLVAGSPSLTLILLTCLALGLAAGFKSVLRVARGAASDAGGTDGHR